MSNQLMNVNERHIRVVGEHHTLFFAARELSKYLGRMTGELFLLEREKSFENEIVLGVFGDLEKSPRFSHEDPRFDDEIYADLQDGKGVISGVNPRSVLLSVYRMLTELGCRWVRPGALGEIIPRVAIEHMDCHISEKPSLRHRGLCLEGANTFENAIEMLEWMPKVGMNTFFMEFMESYAFFNNWTSQSQNKKIPGYELPVDTARRYHNQIIEEAKKRDMIYHGVGHGWTCEPLELPSLGWGPFEGEVKEEYKDCLALINGKREIWGGEPLNFPNTLCTNLCYSSEKVRRLMTECITNYAKKHSYIDVLHFWLADGYDNQCECDSCIRKTPSDWMVIMLNELDEKLTHAGLETTICFVLYVELLWAPEVERLNNPSRFKMLWAPITRTYSKSYREDPAVQMPPFVLNRNVKSFPKTIEQNVASLRDWQQVFDGDSLTFEYHMMWDHYNDPGYFSIGRVLSEDIRNLGTIGLNGYICDQPFRVFMPTGLPMHIMARTLYDTGLTFDEIATDYFAYAFGADASRVQAFCERMSELFEPAYFRREKPWQDEQAAERFSSVEAVVAEFVPIIKRNLWDPSPVVSESYRILDAYTGYLTRYAKMAVCLAHGDKEAAARICEEEVCEYLSGIELGFQDTMDGYEMMRHVRGKIKANALELVTMQGDDKEHVYV
ncbi:DUF4838 domain-containing protein [Paenibacillus koleovorans]|uniref:DUF4838 domain-containing protein n=1 Tax=Paenibacillus koleovorans TaxID=121608 RepID=UPI000FDCB3DF|nr:DUF4838 domain-containing protein [Paenibacillus koleovorans]